MTKGNLHQPVTAWTQRQTTVSPGLMRVRHVARTEKTGPFTALLHHVTPELLATSYSALKRKAAAGIDGCTWESYGENLQERLDVLHARLHDGSYRAKPARRVYIDKADGTKRPLSILCVEDKIAQHAVSQVLHAIYEEEFIGFSYGFRPGRSQHRALDALYTGLLYRKVNWVLDLDIQRFFDAVNHDWMIRMLAHRIADRRVLRLICAWLKVGIADDKGRQERSECGLPQGAVISPVLANVFLHYVFDLWSHKWRSRQAQGDMIIIRFADDGVPRRRGKEAVMVT